MLHYSQLFMPCTIENVIFRWVEILFSIMKCSFPIETSDERSSMYVIYMLILFYVDESKFIHVKSDYIYDDPSFSRLYVPYKFDMYN